MKLIITKICEIEKYPVYVTMAHHSSHITNFHAIQTVCTFFIPYSELRFLVDNFVERLEWSSVMFFCGFKFHAHSVMLIYPWATGRKGEP